MPALFSREKRHAALLNTSQQNTMILIVIYALLAMCVGQTPSPTPIVTTRNGQCTYNAGFEIDESVYYPFLEPASDGVWRR